MDGAVAALFFASLMVLTWLVFLGALLHKLFDFAEFQGFVADYRLLPELLVKPAALVLVVLESAVVVLLPVAATRVIALAVAAGLLALYALAILANVRRGRTRVECGCGGAPQHLGAALVWRNLALAALALAALWGQPHLAHATEAGMAVLAGIFLWLMYRFFDQSHANWQGLKIAGSGMNAGQRQ